MTTMSKNKKAVNDQLNEQQPTVYDDLLKNGTAILEAPTREALAELVDNIPTDVKYCVGTVGQNPTTGTFTIRVDKI
jgi:hypothetical protein